MKRWIAGAAFTAGVALSAPAAAQDSGLSLRQVLRSVRASHPSVEIARQRVLAAQGGALSARGAFDPKVELGGKALPLGKYTKGQVGASVSQQTNLWGARVWAGWRRGFGSVPVYDGQLETLSAGEFSTGFVLPLWQGGPIDAMRAQLRQADNAALSSEQEQKLITLLLENMAAHAFWGWVEAGHLLKVQEGLLQVAETRATGLRTRITKGAAAQILGIDADRMVFDRRAKVVKAQRKTIQAAAKLGLYWRDSAGRPRQVPLSALPPLRPTPGAPSQAAMNAHIQGALRRRPDLKMLDLAAARQQIEVDFRDNQVAPRIDLKGWVAKDVGSGKEELDPLDVGVGLSVKMPLLFRKARGKLAASRAKLASVKQKSQLAADKVAADVRIAHAAVVGAAQIAQLAVRQRTAAEQIAEAERRKFALGETDLLKVNLRELSAAKAASEAIRARVDHERADADYRTAGGLSPR